MLCILCILAALFCLGYCLVVFSIHSGGRFYLIWGLGGIFFLGLACMVHFGWWPLIPKVLRRIIIAFVVTCVSLFAVIEGCIISQYHAKGEPGLDYIIVLGAQMKQGGPSAVLKFRLDEAYRYLIENENTICIVSGGQGSNEPCSEAEGMYRYLVEQGISPERILLEDQSTDTSENIAYSAKLIDKEDASVGVVTNNFHVFRSVHIAKNAGFDHVSGIAARSNVYFQLNNMVREFFGVLKDFVCGNMA